MPLSKRFAVCAAWAAVPGESDAKILALILKDLAARFLRFDQATIARAYRR